MTNPEIPVYQIDAHWTIVMANDAFCHTFKCTPAEVIGRDVRDLLRRDGLGDFRTYVTRALLGVGDLELMVPMVAPGGQLGWYAHKLEPLRRAGRVSGYRATVQPQAAPVSIPPKRWWEWRTTAAHTVWDFEPDQLVPGRTRRAAARA